MKWSYRVAEFSGIAVYVHATFFVLLAFVAVAFLVQGAGLSAALSAVAFIVALFACVVAHEFGHALTARRFGIQTKEITLLPIGGIARLERMPREPMQELWIALAGPAVNVGIAALLLVWLIAADWWRPVHEIGIMGADAFLERLLMVNLFLVFFNMLPAFPMDGGRVLRALMATRMDYSRATILAASIGQAMAIGFAFLGLFTNPLLLLIAFFVWVGAGQEAAQVQMRTAMAGIPVARAMITQFSTLQPGDTLSRAVELILSGSQQDFPVVLGDEVVGILTRQDLLTALARLPQDTPVSEVMQRDFRQVDESETLESAFTRLQECACHTMPVTSNGRLVGLLTLENVGEFVMIQTALSASRQPA
jgi:Zn-dependent protease